jgi:hypothetical protein
VTAVKRKKSVTLRLNRERLFRWQCELATRLAASADIDLAVCLVDGQPLPPVFKLYIALEALIFRLRGNHACDLLGPDAFAMFARTEQQFSDVILDLSGELPQENVPNEIRPLHDGAPSDAALIGAVLENRRPEISIVDTDGHVLLGGLPAIEDTRVLIRALDTALSGLMSMCLKAVVGSGQANERVMVPNWSSPSFPNKAVLWFGLQSLQAKLNNRIAELCGKAPRWFVAWRNIDATSHPMSVPDAAAYRPLADDGTRYYADPFALVVAGQTYLFVEEFDAASAKAIISCAPMQPDGSFGRPTPVLEESSHLSYPQVFSHGGEIWMVPESSASRSVNLYRAARFPDRWVHETTLVQDAEISDATIFESGGLWWMFATKREWLGSSWDSMNVFWAEQLHGRWAPHINNPIVIDSRFARPAGSVFEYNGALVRPAQDCSEAYGGGLAFCRIDRLDRECVRETVHTTVQLRGRNLRRGPHTFNRTATTEFIDLFGIR